MLLGGNNRLIGTAQLGAPTLRLAVLGAERARAIAPGADFSFHVADDRQWYWRMHDDRAAAGPLVAVSASGFARRLDAQRASRRFRAAATGAQIQLGLVSIPDRVRERQGPSLGQAAER
ncbi:hypothetical protein [Actinophytocola sediminis]